MKTKLFYLLCFVTTTVLANPPEEQGKTIFSSRCASCHSVNKVLTGPALANVEQRHSFEWIVRFVHSSQTMVKSGDKEAVALFEKFNKIPMPDHPDLTKDDIKNIIAYISAESKNAGGDKAPFAKPLRLTTKYTPPSADNYGLFLAFFAVVAILVLALLFAVQLKEYERNSVAD